MVITIFLMISGKLMGLSYGFDVNEELAWNIGSILGLHGAEKMITGTKGIS